MRTEAVEVKEPICESDVEKTFDIPYSGLYRVEAKCPDGTTKVFMGVRAFTESVMVDGRGYVTVKIGSKSPGIWNGNIPYPYHYLHRDTVLCALKIHNMETMSGNGVDTFALNYNLFCLPWKLCILMHETLDGPMAFMTSRAEWDAGEVDVKNREAQMFIGVPQERHVPADLMKLVVQPEISQWIDLARAEITRKRKRKE